MHPLATSAFDLPDRLAPKADPALIAGDERHFAAVADTLEESISDLVDRLEVRACGARRCRPGGDGPTWRSTGSPLGCVLRRFGLDLCLGRMVEVDDPEPVYVGRLGLTDRSGRRLLVDWRSPAAEPFFAATHANPMGLASRRRYRWTRGRVSDYWDEVFTPDGLEGTPRSTISPLSSPAWAAAGRPGCATCSAPSKPTRTPSSARVPAARSSSTAVRERGRPWWPCTARPISCTPTLASVTAAAVLFVGPHHPYLAYVADVLPSLGEEGVQTCTLRDLVAEGAAATFEADPTVARLKSSADLVQAIEPAVKIYEEPPTAGMTVETLVRHLAERRRVGRGVRR